MNVVFLRRWVVAFCVTVGVIIIVSISLRKVGRISPPSVILMGGSVGYNRGVKQLFTLRTFFVYSAKQGDLLS